jgi:hypothetical protein
MRGYPPFAPLAALCPARLPARRRSVGTGSKRRGRPAPSGTTASPDTDPSPPGRTDTGSSGLQREESRALQDVALLVQHPHLPPQPPQLLALFGRQPVALAGMDRRLAIQWRTAVSLRSSSRQVAGTDRSPGPSKARTSALNSGERAVLPSACPVPLHLLPHPDFLLVGSRPHLERLPAGGKSRDEER